MSIARADEDLRYFTPIVADAPRIGAMARASFSETFAPLYDPEPFARFCDEAYGTGGTMARHLADPEVSWQAAECGDEVIGYAKLSALDAPAPKPKPSAMELRQLYVAKPWHGCGVGDALMAWALEAARERGAPEIYLTVFEHNERAKRFYARYGFAEVGRCTFRLGEREDEDRIWGRQL